MSSRHVRWVLANRHRYPDQLDREIMIAIATHIGYDDRPAHLSIATIAEYVGCHYNTVDKRTKTLAEAGHLIIAKDGRLLTYVLPDSADEETHPGDEPPPGQGPQQTELQDQIDELRADVKELKDIVTSLSHDLHTIVTSSSHHRHTSFTSDQGNNVNKGVEGVEGGKEGDIYAREGPLDGGPEPFKPAPRTKDQSDREEMIAAIAQVVKNTYVPGFNDEPFLDTASALVRADVTPDQVRGFSEWWEANGYYAGQPALKSMIDEWGNYSAGISPRASPNGRHGEPKEPAGFSALRKVLGELEDG